MGQISVSWSRYAEEDLEQIYQHYCFYAPEKADLRVQNILKAIDELTYYEQWQVDEYDPKSRRMIVDQRFRVLYRRVAKGILIIRVYPIKKDPEGIGLS